MKRCAYLYRGHQYRIRQLKLRQSAERITQHCVFCVFTHSRRANGTHRTRNRTGWSRRWTRSPSASRRGAIRRPDTSPRGGRRTPTSKRTLRHPVRQSPTSVQTWTDVLFTQSWSRLCWTQPRTVRKLLSSCSTRRRDILFTSRKRFMRIYALETCSAIAFSTKCQNFIHFLSMFSI